MSVPALYATNLAKNYLGKPALNLSSICLEEGTVLTVMGANGAGKTTLIRLLSLLELQDKGEIIIWGKSVPSSQRERLPLRRQMGVIWQRPSLFQMSVMDNIALGLRLRGMEEPEIQERVTQISRRFDLTPLLSRWPGELSGGEVQKVSVARTLVLEPRILFVDEPNTYLDVAGVHLVEEAVREETRRRKTAILIITHNRDQARAMADRAIILDQGAMVWSGPAADL